MSDLLWAVRDIAADEPIPEPEECAESDEIDPDDIDLAGAEVSPDGAAG